VRESVAALLAVLGIIGGYYVYQTRTTAAVPEVAVQSASPFGAKSRQSLKGVPLGKRTNKKHHSSVTSHGKDEGSAVDVATSESVPSIYPQESSGSAVEKAARDGESEAKTTVSHVGGVPVQGWLRSRRNSLPAGVLAPPPSSGLRVFVDCMEIKGIATQPLSQKECGALAIRPNERASNYH